MPGSANSQPLGQVAGKPGTDSPGEAAMQQRRCRGAAGTGVVGEEEAARRVPSPTIYVLRASADVNDQR